MVSRTRTLFGFPVHLYLEMHGAFTRVPDAILLNEDTGVVYVDVGRVAEVAGAVAAEAKREAYLGR